MRKVCVAVAAVVALSGSTATAQVVYGVMRVNNAHMT